MPRNSALPNSPAPQASSKSGIFFGVLLLIVAIAIGIPIAGFLTTPKQTKPAVTMEEITAPQVNTKTTNTLTEYRNDEIGILIRYPNDWKKGSSESIHFSGSDGFFSLETIPATTGSLDEIAQKESEREEQPYGSRPEILRASLRGNEARLIRPSSDQASKFATAALLLLALPESVTTDEGVFAYIAMWIDSAHIESIANSIEFF